MSDRLPLNWIMSFCREQIPERGEDSFCYASCDTAGMVAVFDGCGGSGAQKHACYSNHTEAYIASRLCAGVVYDDFCQDFPNERPTSEFVRNKLMPDFKKVLDTYAPPQEEGSPRIRGSLVRTLPTTIAMAIVRPGQEDWLQVDAIWAGDSRVYVLDSNGLAQLTADDTTQPDPFENLYEDGILRNVICQDKPVRINVQSFQVKLPFMVLAASDGCFGYVSTPMEFEAMLLSTFLKSSSIDQWEKNLADVIGGVAGDDHSLCLAAYGYESMDALCQDLAQRFGVLNNEYLQPLERVDPDDRQFRRELWEKYCPNYCRYLKDGINDGNAG